MVDAATLCFAAGIALLAASRLGAINALGPAVQLSDFAFAAGVVCALAATARRTLRPRYDRADTALALFGLAALLSLAATPSPRDSLIKLLGLGLLASLYLVGSHLFADPRRRKLLVGVWLVTAAISAVLGLAGVVLFYLGHRTPGTNPFIGEFGGVPVGNYPRIVALFSQPNMYCSYCVATLALIGEIWPSRPANHGALLVLAALLAVNAVFTLSTGLGGLALGSGLWWYLRGGRGRALALAIGALCALAFALVTVVELVPRGAGDLALGPFDVRVVAGSRIDIWRGALRTWAAHPVAGAGYGQHVGVTTDPRVLAGAAHVRVTPEMVSRGAVEMEAHNIWLSVLGQVGVLGLVALVAFVSTVLRGRAAGQTAIFCGLVAIVLYHGLFAALEDARHVWLLFGVAVAPQRR